MAEKSITQTIVNLRRIQSAISKYLFLHPYLSNQNPNRYAALFSIKTLILPSHINVFERLMLQYKIAPPLFTCTIPVDIFVTISSFNRSFDHYGAFVIKKMLLDTCDLMNEGLQLGSEQTEEVLNEKIRKAIVKCRNELEQCWKQQIRINILVRNIIL